MFTTSDNYHIAITQVGTNAVWHNTSLPTNRLACVLVEQANKQLFTVISMKAIGCTDVWKITFKRNHITPLGFDVNLYLNRELVAELSCLGVTYAQDNLKRKDFEFAAYLLSGVLYHLKNVGKA